MPQANEQLILMNLRKIIITVAGLLILAASIYGFGLLKATKPVKTGGGAQTNAVTVRAVEVVNKPQEGKIPLTGRVVAAEQIELYAEVSGQAAFGATPFKAGNRFRKGELMLSLDKSEIQRSLAASKTQLVSLIVKSLADIKMDYPKEFPAWRSYAESLDAEAPLPDLPEVGNDALRFYLTGRNVYTTFYNIRQSEARLEKYDIRAPFTGTLTEARVFEGALVRVGQPLGEFMQTEVFELEASVNYSYLKYLEKGMEIRFSDVNHEQSYAARLSRINDKVDPATQLVKLYFTLRDAKLKSGLYLQTELVTHTYEQAAEIPVTAVLDEDTASFIYVIQSEKAQKQPVVVLERGATHALVTGLKDGQRVIIDRKNSAFEGSSVIEMDPS